MKNLILHSVVAGGTVIRGDIWFGEHDYLGTTEFGLVKREEVNWLPLSVSGVMGFSTMG